MNKSLARQDNGFNPVILGDYLKKTAAGDFILLDVIHQPFSVITKHIHEYAGITLTISGSSTRRFNTRSQGCISDSILTTPAGEPHIDQFGGAGARCLHIKINPKRTEALSSFSDALRQPVYIQGDYPATLARRVYKEMKIIDSASILSLESLMLEMLAHLTRTVSKNFSHSTPPAWLHEARDFIRDCFDQQISLNDVANSVGINAPHLARMFRKHYQVSVGEYIRKLRLNYAAQQLSKSEKSLIEIANASGFYDQSHFSHAFKLQTGLTPGEFRNLTRSGKSDTNHTQTYNIS